jgi:hypothetical protein
MGVVGIHSGFNVNPSISPNGLSNGTDTSNLQRVAYKAPAGSGIGVMQLCWQGWQMQNDAGTGEVDAPNDVTVSALLEYPTGVFNTQFTINGALTGVVKPGQELLSDPKAVNIPAGATFWIRSVPTVTSGQKWINNHQSTSGNGLGEGAVANGTSLTAAIANSAVRFYSPIVLGTTNSTIPQIIVAGDSITQTFNDLGDPSKAANAGRVHNGWPQIVAASAGVPVHNLAMASTTMQTLMDQTKGFRRRNVLRRGNVAFLTYGRNDLGAGRTLAQMQADALAFANACINSGVVPVICTILPSSTSSNRWTDTAGQTPEATASVRNPYNDWARALPSPFAFCLDLASVAETSQNSGIWKTGPVLFSGTFTSTVTYAAASASATFADNTKDFSSINNPSDGLGPMLLVVTSGAGAGRYMAVGAATAGGNLTVVPCNDNSALTVTAGDSYVILDSGTANASGNASHPSPRMMRRIADYVVSQLPAIQALL